MFSLFQILLLQFTVLQDHAQPIKYVVDRNKSSDPIVTRVRTVAPGETELFSLRILLMDSPFSFFENAKVVGTHSYRTYKEAAVTRGLYANGDEFQKAFDEAVRYHSTPEELRCMLTSMYQQGGDPGEAMEKHKEYLYSDIREGSQQDKLKVLFKRVLEISDRHGGRLLRDHHYF